MKEDRKFRDGEFVRVKHLTQEQIIELEQKIWGTKSTSFADSMIKASQKKSLEVLRINYYKTNFNVYELRGCSHWVPEEIIIYPSKEIKLFEDE